MYSEKEEKLKELRKLKEPIYNIKLKDGRSDGQHPQFDKNVRIEDILLYIHDGLHDMCNKGDTLKVTLLKDLDMDYSEARMVNSHKHLHESRYDWVLDKKYLIKY